MSSENVNETAAQAKVSECHVQVPPFPWITPDKAWIHDSAAFYELADGVFTAMIKNRVIPIADIDFLVQVMFTFEGFGPIRLSRDEIKFCTTNEKLNATIIELTEQCVKRFQHNGAKFIRLAIAVDGNSIPMAQLAEDEFSFDNGDFKRLLSIAVFHLATSR